MLFNRRGAIVFVGAASALSLGFSTPALAEPIYQATDVKTTITGGKTVAVSKCGNLAKNGKDIKQIAFCDNVDSVAIAGGISLKDVNIIVVDRDATGTDKVNKFTSVDTVLKGGDAEAVSECINVATDGSDKVEQTTACGKVSSTALGGDIKLENVDIKVES